MRISSIARAAAFSCGALVLAGCQYSPEIADRTIAFNEAVAESTNSLLLLNAVRASKHEPTYYTRLASDQATGIMQLPSAKITSPLGSSVTTTASVVTTVVAKAAKTFESSFSATEQNQLSLSNADDQKSINGLKSIVSQSIINQFLYEGWDPELVYLMYVSEITVPTLFLEKVPDALRKYCHFPEEKNKEYNTKNRYCTYFWNELKQASYETKPMPCFFHDAWKDKATGETPKYVTLMNNPARDVENVPSFKCFQQALRAVLTVGLKIDTPPNNEIANFISVDDIKKNPKLLSALSDAGYEIELTNGDDPPENGAHPKIKITKKGSAEQFAFHFEDTKIEERDLAALVFSSIAKDDSGGLSRRGINKPITILVSKEVCSQINSDPKNHTKNACKKNAVITDITFSTRSLEGMVYYLGQIIRRKVEIGNVDPVTYLHVLSPDGGQKQYYEAGLFDVKTGVPPPDAFASVRIGTDFYYIPHFCAGTPETEPDRKCNAEYPNHSSAQIIDFINQIWGLNKEATALPSVSNVTVLPSP